MKYILIAVLSMLLGFGISQEYYSKVEKIVKTDTLTIVPEPIVLERVKPKLIYKRDTIIETKPFTAILDTIYKFDTIQVNYDYPENNMRIAIRMATDTVYNEYETLKEECKKQEWWEAPAIAAGGIILGILITKSSK
ncbi:hypothetical protein EP342_02060 [bacterium]|nr:MAG: hypothetical protein EP342_02060 [bacterium]